MIKVNIGAATTLSIRELKLDAEGIKVQLRGSDSLREVFVMEPRRVAYTPEILEACKALMVLLATQAANDMGISTTPPPPKPETPAQLPLLINLSGEEDPEVGGEGSLQELIERKR